MPAHHLPMALPCVSGTRGWIPRWDVSRGTSPSCPPLTSWSLPSRRSAGHVPGAAGPSMVRGDHGDTSEGSRAPSLPHRGTSRSAGVGHADGAQAEVAGAGGVLGAATRVPGLRSTERRIVGTPSSFAPHGSWAVVAPPLLPCAAPRNGLLVACVQLSTRARCLLRTRVTLVPVPPLLWGLITRY